MDSSDGFVVRCASLRDCAVEPCHDAIAIFVTRTFSTVPSHLTAPAALCVLGSSLTAREEGDGGWGGYERGRERESWGGVAGLDGKMTWGRAERRDRDAVERA